MIAVEFSLKVKITKNDLDNASIWENLDTMFKGNSLIEGDSQDIRKIKEEVQSVVEDSFGIPFDSLKIKSITFTEDEEEE